MIFLLIAGWFVIGILFTKLVADYNDVDFSDTAMFSVTGPLMIGVFIIFIVLGFYNKNNKIRKVREYISKIDVDKKIFFKNKEN